MSSARWCDENTNRWKVSAIDLQKQTVVEGLEWISVANWIRSARLEMKPWSFGPYVRGSVRQGLNGVVVIDWVSGKSLAMFKVCPSLPVSKIYILYTRWTLCVVLSSVPLTASWIFSSLRLNYQSSGIFRTSHSDLLSHFNSCRGSAIENS